MKVKNSIKKVGAITGSALMVGLSVGAAASLSEFPQPFVDGDGEVASQIVVGSSGNVADVVGAVNVAAALGQAAIQTEERQAPGASTTDVDGVEGETSIRSTWGPDTEINNLNYDTMFFGTMDTDNDEERTVEESASLTANQIEVVTNSTEVATEIGDKSITYTVNYGQGFGANDEVLVLGETYTLTEVDNADSEIKLGSREEHRNLAAGDTVEHGPWSFEIIDVDRDNSRVRIDVYEDGEFETSATLADDSSNGDVMDEFGSDDEFRVEVDDIWFGDNLDQVHIDTVYSDMTVEDSEPSPFDADWESGLTFNGTGNGITQLDLSNLVALEHDHDDEEENLGEALQEGDSFAGPSDYFNVYQLGLTDHSTTDLDFEDERGVSFTDVNNVDHTLDLKDWYGATIGTVQSNLADGEEGFVSVTHDSENIPIAYEVDGSTLTLEYRGTENTLELNFMPGTGTDTDTVSVGGVDVTVVADAGTSEYNFNSPQTSMDVLYNDDTETGSTISDVDADTVDVVESSGDHTVTVAWATGGTDLDSVTYNHDDTSGSQDGTLAAEDDPVYTAYGSVVEFADTDEASIVYPSEQVEVEHGFGSTDVSETDGETYEALAERGDLPSMAQLDSEVTESVRDNNHLILVGGPAVNTLTEELHDNGDIDLSDLSDAESGALLQTVDDAFSSGQHALVVAGYGADDTRSASQYLANYADNADALEDAGDRLVLTEADYPTEQ